MAAIQELCDEGIATLLEPHSSQILCLTSFDLYLLFFYYLILLRSDSWMLVAYLIVVRNCWLKQSESLASLLFREVSSFFSSRSLLTRGRNGSSRCTAQYVSYFLCFLLFRHMSLTGLRIILFLYAHLMYINFVNYYVLAMIAPVIILVILFIKIINYHVPYISTLK